MEWYYKLLIFAETTTMVLLSVNAYVSSKQVRGITRKVFDMWDVIQRDSKYISTLNAEAKDADSRIYDLEAKVQEIKQKKVMVGFSKKYPFTVEITNGPASNGVGGFPNKDKIYEAIKKQFAELK